MLLEGKSTTTKQSGCVKCTGVVSDENSVRISAASGKEFLKIFKTFFKRNRVNRIVLSFSKVLWPLIVSIDNLLISEAW